MHIRLSGPETLKALNDRFFDILYIRRDGMGGTQAVMMDTGVLTGIVAADPERWQGAFFRMRCCLFLPQVDPAVSGTDLNARSTWPDISLPLLNGMRVHPDRRGGELNTIGPEPDRWRYVLNTWQCMPDIRRVELNSSRKGFYRMRTERERYTGCLNRISLLLKPSGEGFKRSGHGPDAVLMSLNRSPR